MEIMFELQCDDTLISKKEDIIICKHGILGSGSLESFLNISNAISCQTEKNSESSMYCHKDNHSWVCEIAVPMNEKKQRLQRMKTDQFQVHGITISSVHG
eukprot:m.107723 g.107723  ORF g.107723 m.107723 type:complete len:100 (+) comp13941_c0_seq10:821-1120(+)